MTHRILLKVGQDKHIEFAHFPVGLGKVCLPVLDVGVVADLAGVDLELGSGKNPLVKVLVVALGLRTEVVQFGLEDMAYLFVGF